MTSVAVAIVALAVGLALGWAAARRRPEPAPPGETPTPAVDGEWLLALLTGMDEGVVAFDVSGRVVFANPAAVRLLGRRAVPSGTPMAAFADIPRLRSTIVASMRGGTPTARELDVPGPPPRVVQLRVTPGAMGVVAVLLDVTEVRRIERGWREFAGTTSHELKTPVAAILSNLEALEAAEGAPEGLRRRFVQASRRQADRLAQLVSDLVDLVRIEARGAVSPADLEAVPVSGACARAVDEVDIDRRVVVEPTEVVARADEWMLQRILTNLLTNALRYSEGPIRVETRPLGDRVQIAVVDQGPGVPEAHRERIFDRFYRVDEGRSRDRGGTGLGLAIVRELVAGMGGTVALEPSEEGARFVVELARANGSEAARTPVAAPPAEH